MANKELVFKLKFVDENGAIVQKTAQNITDINKSIKDLKSELENTELGSEQWNTLASDLGEAENALGKVNTATQKAKESQQTLGETLTNLPGPIGQTIKGAQALNASLMKLVLNPIGAIIAGIVLGLTALYKAFTSTKAGGEAVERVMAGISAVMDVLRDRVLKVGGALVKFISGDFAGAADDLRGAFDGIGAEITGEFEEAGKLKGELQSIADAERELTKSRAEQNKEIAKAKLVINDETKSYGERQKALEEVRKAEIALSKQEEILAQRKYDAIKAQNAMSDSSKEALNEEAAAFAILQQKQLESLTKQKEIFDQQKALRDKEKSEQKAAADARKAQLQAIRDFEQAINLEAIKDERLRAETELQINRDKQIQQLKELRVGKTKEAELLAKIEENYQVKRLAIEQAGYAKSVEAYNAFRQFLITSQINRDTTELTLRQSFLDQGLQALENYTNNAKQTRELDDRDREFSLLFAEASIDSLKDAYKNLYETQVFAAKEALADDLKNTEVRAAEQKKQIDDAEAYTRGSINRKIQALRDEGKSEEEIRKQTANIVLNERETQAIRVSEINDYFRDYEKERIKSFETEVELLAVNRVNNEIAAEKRLTDAKQKLRDQEQAAINAQRQLAIEGLNVLSELAGDNFALSQSLAIASTTISTYDAAQKAYASQLAIPTPDAPVRAAVAAGIAVATGLARVIAIANTAPPEKAADGMVVGQGSGRLDNVGVMVSNGETIINSRSSKIFKPLLSAINQAGGGKRFAGGGVVGLSTQTSPETSLLNNIANISSSSPIKTYVVASDVSTTASLDRQIKSRSVL
jgi:hypothetical protein